MYTKKGTQEVLVQNAAGVFLWFSMEYVKRNIFDSGIITGIILERGLAGFPQFGKKSRIKFKSPGQMGRPKNRPKDKLSTTFLK